MPRGGRRKGAGRKTQWESGCSFAETTVVRVPKVLKNEILEIAHRLDAGEEIDLVSKSIKERNNYLEGKVLKLENELKKLLNQNLEKVTKSKKKNKIVQLNLVTESKLINPVPGQLLSIKRLGLSKNAASESKKRYSVDKFAEWSQKQDPDHIPWIPNPKGRGYIPKNELSSELKSKLLKWIENNSQS